MDIGIWEMATVCIFLFILYGEKFPDMARKVGRTINQLKKIWEEEILK